jgi:hypothetical protein
VNEKANPIRRATAIMLAFCAISLGIWDVLVARNALENDTISEIVRDISHDFYVLPFALMAVMGHFFVNRKTAEEIKPERFWWLVGACLLVLARDCLNQVVPLPTFHYANISLGAVGFALGVLWWPQGPQVVDQN